MWRAKDISQAGTVRCLTATARSFAGSDSGSPAISSSTFGMKRLEIPNFLDTFGHEQKPTRKILRPSRNIFESSGRSVPVLIIDRSPLSGTHSFSVVAPDWWICLSKLRGQFNRSRKLPELKAASFETTASHPHSHRLKNSKIARPKVSHALQMISPDSNWFLIDGEQAHDPIATHAATFQRQIANRLQSFRRPGGFAGQAIRTPIAARPKAQPKNAATKYQQVASNPRRPFSRQNPNNIRLGRRCDEGLLIYDC